MDTEVIALTIDFKNPVNEINGDAKIVEDGQKITVKFIAFLIHI